jgi:hypothetical protein
MASEELQEAENRVLDYIRSTNEYSEMNFQDSHSKIWVLHNSLISAAKIYIIDNYKSIDDYSDLDLILRSGATGKRFYFGPKRNREVSRSKELTGILKELDKQTIVIESFNKAIYDWTDGDFSVVFNEESYNWIDDDSVIGIASYIEKKLGENEI